VVALEMRGRSLVEGGGGPVRPTPAWDKRTGGAGGAGGARGGTSAASNAALRAATEAYIAAAGGRAAQPRCLGKTPLSRAEGQTDQNAGKKSHKEGNWYVVEMNVAERKATVLVGTGANGGSGG